MKLSDDACDVGDDKSLAIALGLLCAITSAFATVSSASAAYIFIGILIGNLLALKVDGIHHIITLVLCVLISLVMGIPELSVVILLICIFSALLDEVGHELISNLTENKFLNYFFEYRCAMKVAIFLLAVCGVFNIFFFVLFILFEFAYGKDDDKTALYGVEMLFVAIMSLVLLYTCILHKDKFIAVANIVACIGVLYYLVKSISIYIREKLKWKKTISDVKEIVAEE